MAKYKRQKVKRYRRSFYSRGTRIKKGIGIVVLVLAVLGAAWLVKSAFFHGRSSYNLYGLYLYAPVRQIEIN